MKKFELGVSSGCGGGEGLRAWGVDDPSAMNGRGALKSALLRCPPAEIITPVDGLPAPLVSLLRAAGGNPPPPVATAPRLEGKDAARLLKRLQSEKALSGAVAQAAVNLLGFLDSALLLDRFLAVALEVDQRGQPFVAETNNSSTPQQREANADWSPPPLTFPLDPATALNLGVVPQPGEGESLLGLLTRCVTPGGRRLLRRWVLAPLVEASAIRRRQEAIIELGENSTLRETVLRTALSLGDLERSLNSAFKLAVPPPSRVVNFSDLSGRRLRDLSALLGKLESAASALTALRGCSSAGLRRLGAIDLATLRSAADSVRSRFALDPAGGPPRPRAADAAFDSAAAAAAAVEADALAELKELKRKLDAPEAALVPGKCRFELELPEAWVAKRGKPPGLEFSSRRAGFERFVGPSFLALEVRIEAAEDAKRAAMTTFATRVFAAFLESRRLWESVAESMAEFDALASLAVFSFDPLLGLTKPELIDEDPSVSLQRVSVSQEHENPSQTKPTLSHAGIFDAKNLRHPLLAALDPYFVGNNLFLGPEQPVLILTGPNMGGKSTLMRSVGLNVLLAQLGAFVFCDSLRLSPVDRIFTRIGASDKLEHGKSTFFVEMEETLTIINEATPRSLLLIDELGRGTATHDGFAIAASILKHILRTKPALTLFSTHYFLIQKKIEDHRVGFARMGYALENSPDGEQKMKFLYKIEQGLAEKSFAFNVAMIAGVPIEVVKRAEEISVEYRAVSDL